MSILLVEDHALVRAGLKRLLATLDQGDIIEAANGHDALLLLRARRPGLVILDLNLPGLGGLELLRRMIQAGAGPILVLTMHAEPLYAKRALDAGAAGYVTKNATPDELLTAVRRVTAGGRYVEAELAQALAAPASGGRKPLDNLTARELEIMRLLAKGASLAEIANNCGQIKSKLGVSRTADLVRLAIETGVG
jgi:DNA-binding NarL/FixJ family response regulator